MEPIQLDAEERNFAEGFYLVDKLLQHINDNQSQYSANGTEARLLLSTCRNHFLTINGIFADARALFEAGLGRRTLLAQLRDLSIQGLRKQYKEAEGKVSVACIAAKDKFAVWRRADIVMEAIEKACAGFSPRRVEQDALKQLLATPAEVIDGEPVENPSLIRLDTSRLPSLQPQEQALTQVFEYAESVLELAKSIAQETMPSPPEQLTLFSESGRQQTKRAGFFEELSLRCGQMGGQVTGEGSEIELLGTDNLLRIKAVESSVESAKRVFEYCSAFEDRLIQRMTATFPPNLARRELPTIFRIAFPQDLSRAADKTARSISTELVDVNVGKFETYSVLCPGFGMPLNWYQEDIRRFTDIGRQNAIKQLRAMLSRSKTCSEFRLLLLPEYFVPIDMQDEISKFCEDNRCIAIYGLEARNSDRQIGAVANEAIVDFSAFKPKLPANIRMQQGRVSVHKCFPAKFEPKLETTSTVPVFRQTPIGNFAVVICSDLLEQEVVNAIHACPAPLNAVFVVAMNPSPGVFEPLVSADAVRLHCPVIVASNCVSLIDTNCCTSQGTIIAEPKRRRSELKALATIDGRRRIIEPSGDATGLDLPTVSTGTGQQVSDGQTAIVKFTVDYSYMNDIRTKAIARDHLPPGSSNSI